MILNPLGRSVSSLLLSFKLNDGKRSQRAAVSVRRFALRSFAFRIDPL